MQPRTVELARQERERRIRAAERRVEARGEAAVSRARSELEIMTIEARAELRATAAELARMIAQEASVAAWSAPTSPSTTDGGMREALAASGPRWVEPLRSVSPPPAG